MSLFTMKWGSGTTRDVKEKKKSKIKKNPHNIKWETINSLNELPLIEKSYISIISQNNESQGWSCVEEEERLSLWRLHAEWICNTYIYSKSKGLGVSQKIRHGLHNFVWYITFLVSNKKQNKTKR